MRIIIVGAGEVGTHLAGTLSSGAHDITVIEASPEQAEFLGERIDGRVLGGDGSSITTLEEAGVAECDVFLALTSDDNTNLVSASLAKALGARRTIARVHPPRQQDMWLFDYRSHFQVDHVFSTERLAALELVKFIRDPGRVQVEEVGRGKLALKQVTLEPDSPAANKTLAESGLPSRIRVGCIERAGRTFIPTGADALHVGDILTVFGEPSQLSAALKVLMRGASERINIRVVIFGGGHYGLALAQMLPRRNYHLKIFEGDRRRCEELAHLLGDADIIHADATSLDQMREEQVGEADFFVAVSADDEDNVMTCLQARHLGARHCLCIIHRADYAEAVSRSGGGLGILAAVSPRVATSNDLVRFLTNERVTTVMRLGGGTEVIEGEVKPGSKLIGQRVREITWPPGSGLVARLHGQVAVVPAADDVIEASDVLVAIVSPESRRALVHILQS